MCRGRWTLRTGQHRVSGRWTNPYQFNRPFLEFDPALLPTLLLIQMPEGEFTRHRHDVVAARVHSSLSGRRILRNRHEIGVCMRLSVI